MSERWHPLELDLQWYVDGGDAAAGLVEHLTECGACRQLTADMRDDAGAVQPDRQVLDAIVAAAARQAAPAEFVAALSADPPEPAPGQVWQLWWDTTVLIGVLIEVSTSTVTLWPSTIDIHLADQTCLVVDATHTSLAAGLACWPAQETVVGSFTLHRCLASLPDQDVAAASHAWRSDATLPSGWARGPVRDGADPSLRQSAELMDRAAGLSAASWRDPAWEQSIDAGEPTSLADLLAARGLTATWLAKTLDVPARVAITLYRGSRAPTDEQKVLLAEALEVTEAPARRPDSAVLDALDRPALRGLLRAVAAAEGTDEVKVRRGFDGFRAAARQMEDRQAPDVVAQVRVELARRLDAAQSRDARP